MNDFCKVRNRNLRIDMTNSLEVTSPPHHFESIANFLRTDFSNSRELCDVCLCFETDKILAHSVMLAAFSSTFAEKFKKSEKCLSVDLKFLKIDSVKKVLDFIYFGKVSFRFATLQDDLEAVAYFGVPPLQEEIEKKLVELARQGKCVDVLNLVTANLKTIPHSPSTMLAVSDETVRDIVSILHEMSNSNKLPYEEVLKLSTNTVITMLSSRISDVQKLDIINMSLKWMYERRLNDHKASNILCGLTFGSMTYAKLVHFRNSLIQTAIPVTVGRCVRLIKGENDTLDIAFTYADTSGHQQGIKVSTPSSSFTLANDQTSLGATSSYIQRKNPKIQTSNTSSSHTKFESGYSTSYDYNFDDCSTAMGFTAEDLKRLGLEKKEGGKK
ncbi:hypothetical protein CAEBREN_06206 [Caenorhabditis brenneri]|uniref:BTB domain-containing protein n=1 Tax=Caenorhabditis brenneri TaxID=135651 RepID=G0NBJ6_CAEBE|nr:hypothetical protein CAEBREN_06206 [Caenorhabditis brenneri]